MRQGINVSFDSDQDIPIIEKMPEGMLSKLCRQAVRAWGSGEIDIMQAKKELEEIEEQENALIARKDYLKQKLNVLEQYEIEQKKRDEEMKIKEKSPEQKKYEDNYARLTEIVYRSRLDEIEQKHVLSAYKDSPYNKYLIHMEKFIESIGYIFDGHFIKKKIEQPILKQVEADQ